MCTSVDEAWFISFLLKENMLSERICYKKHASATRTHCNTFTGVSGHSLVEHLT